jgi:hypothetical protein
MNYQNKYLKYKNKYLDLKKKLVGGNVTINNNLISSLVPYFLEKDEDFEDDEENPNNNVIRCQIDLEKNAVNLNNLLIVPMNAFEIIDDDKTILATTGVVDCVVMILYNPETKSRYLTHLLRDIIFTDKINSKAIHDNKGNVNIDDVLVNDEIKSQDCFTVLESLPKWFNQPQIIAYFFNFGEKIKLYNRVQQLINVGFIGTINTYYQKLNFNLWKRYGYYDNSTICEEKNFFKLLNDSIFENKYNNSNCEGILIHSIGITPDNKLVVPIPKFENLGNIHIKELLLRKGMVYKKNIEKKTFLKKYSFDLE